MGARHFSGLWAAAMALALGGCSAGRAPQGLPPLPDENVAAVDTNNAMAVDSGNDMLEIEPGYGNASAEVDPVPPEPPGDEGDGGVVIAAGTRSASARAAPRLGSALPTGAEAAAALDCAGEGFADAACAQMQRQLANARRRDIDVSAEQPMYRGIPAWVRASLRDPARPSETPAGGGPVVTGSVLATKYMRARLSGTGFDIKPDGWQEQETSLNRESDWEWSVTPRIEGRRTLQVTVEPVVRAADGSEVKGDHYGKAVPVTVEVKAGEKWLDRGSLWERLGKQWAATLGALAAAAAAAWGLWRALRGRAAPAAAGGGGERGKEK